MFPRLSSVLFMALFLVSIGAGAIGGTFAIEQYKQTMKVEKVNTPPVKKTKVKYRGIS